MLDTIEQYKQVIEKSKVLFINKTKDYGTAWRVLRNISIVDQIYIKAYRIRTIQENEVQMISDDVASEFTGIINYAIIGLIQLQLLQEGEEEEDLDIDVVEKHYSKYFAEAQLLMQNKNHDYGEAWRNMSQEGFTDLILMKLQRMRQIIANKGKTIISEGLDANYHDIINYAVFALILLTEKKPA